MEYKTITPTDKYEFARHEGINESAIRNMVDAIIRDPKSWNMETWAAKTECGTTMCAAGMAVFQAGYEIQWLEWSTLATRCLRPGDHIDRYIEDVAQELLGFNDYQAEALFSYYALPETGLHPTVEQFVQRVADITGLEFKIPT